MARLRVSKSSACAQCVYEALKDVVSLVGLGESQAKDSAVSGNKGEENTESAEQAGAEFFDEHFDKLHGGSDDSDIANEAQVLDVIVDKHPVDAKGAHGADDHDEDDGEAHAGGSFDFAGNTEEGADAEEHAQYEIIDEACVQEDHRKWFWIHD